MKHLQLYEDFQEGPMQKPQGFLSRMAQGAKHALGFENKEDRQALETIYTAIKDNPKYNWVKNVREIKPGVIVASVADRSVVVDKVTPEIMYKGKSLDLNNLDDETEHLYDLLSRIPMM
jgi:hypothetical protein